MPILKIGFRPSRQADFVDYLQVVVEVTTKDPGTTLRAPTAEAGLAPACKDSCFGDLKLQIWERRYDGSKGKVCSVLWTYHSQLQ